MTNKIFIAMSFALIIAPAISANTWIVALDGSGDFTTIQSAVDAATDEDIIVVRPGTYVESVIVRTKALTIVGSGVQSTIVEMASTIWSPLRVWELTTNQRV